jgi:HSP20 family protein
MEASMVEKSHTAGWWPDLYQPLRNIGQRVADWFAPRSDASALEDYYEINVELPGVKTEDVDVSVEDNSLTVRGEKRYEREETGRTYFFSEREYGAFQRTFRLPPDADGEKIDAEFSDGILRLKVAKRSPLKTEGRRIEVRKT